MGILSRERKNRLFLAAVLGCGIGSYASVSHGEPLAESQKDASVLIRNTKALAKIHSERSSSPQQMRKAGVEPSGGIPFKEDGLERTPTNLFGSFIFLDGDLVGSSIDQVRGGIDKAAFADSFGSAAARVLSSRGMSPATAASESGRANSIPEGIFRIQPTSRKSGCSISNTSEAPLKNSDKVLINQISTRVTVLSCVLVPQQPQYTPAADEGPGTVHGCFCYRVCPPRTDARDSCYRVCECFNGP